MNVERQALMKLNEKPPLCMVRGLGSYLWDEQGRRYLDLVQGWAVNCLGHCPEELTRALTAQLACVVHVGAAYHNQPACALGERLAQLTGLPRVFLASSGAEANEAALKLARRWGHKHRGGAYEIVTTTDSFHGRTLALTSASGKPGFAEPFLPAVEGFPKVPFGDVEAVRRALGPKVVAVMVEPIQGEAGVIVPPPGYLRALRALCDEAGILLVLDEVQTGMGRTGPLFAHLAEEVRPDILTLGKGLGAGLPISAMLAREEVSCFDLGDHGGTFSGHALLSACALAVVERLSSPEQTAERTAGARRLAELLGRLAEQHGLALRGRGHLWALHGFPREGAYAVSERALALGLLLNAPRPDVLRLMPALNIADDELALTEQLLGSALG